MQIGPKLIFTIVALIITLVVATTLLFVFMGINDMYMLGNQ